ncbi:DnaA ATPase domain-containing protein [Butyrivibrio fibrisolvens]|uniref:DnaA ATPase domain-containing protein n=1 Tax=Butyrivibrio fibrisolvens TaxID=831 RepID=UPI0012BD6059|nr:DnaA/Hda family protein [Butyrivibrio fibrisolvens]
MAGVHVRSIDLAPYIDPDDFILNSGPFSFDERIEDARTTKSEAIYTKRQEKENIESKECFTMSSIYNFEKFLTCEGNLIAFNAAKAVANSPTTAYNPLYIYGGHGTGKTHLLKAIETAISESYPEISVLYVTAEKFCNDILEAIRCGDCCEIRDIYRTPDVLLIDDIQFLVGKKTTLSELSHTIDSLLRDGSQIVFSADKPPKKLEVDEHMRSRLGMGLIAELKAPDTAMKNNLVRLKAGERGVLLQDDVVEFISSSMGANISEIEGAITSIVAYSELSRPVITLDTAKTVLKDVIISE